MQIRRQNTFDPYVHLQESNGDRHLLQHFHERRAVVVRIIFYPMPKTEG